jgi:hypothetical protein
MRIGVVVGVGTVLALVAASATDASAGCRRSRVCGAYGPAPVYQYAPPPPPAYYAPPPAPYYAPAPVAAGYGYAPPGYGYAPPGGYYGYRNCDRGYGYGNGYGPPAAYDGYRPAAVWVPVR